MGLPKSFSDYYQSHKVSPNTQKMLLSLMLSSQIIIFGISLVFSVMTLVITVLQPVFVMAAQ
jgi:hypothetical protein